jgi:hypothetical protein
MSCHPWILRRVAPALGCAGMFLFVVVGCGGEGKTDNAVVLPSEPLASGSAPAATGSPSPAPAATTAAPADTAAPAPTAGGAEGWGTIKGRVVFVGDPPVAKVLDTKVKDPEVCAKSEHRSQRLVVDPATKGIKYALVYIPKPTKVNPEAKSSAETAGADFDQKDCMFDPHVFAAMKGAKVLLKSSDTVNHNINAKLRANSTYNQVVSAANPLTYVPAAAETKPVEVTCDIHPWMKAYWLILDNPYFAVTDEQGNFEIKNAPAGTQKLIVWQEALDKQGFLTGSSGDPVVVKANETTTLPDFRIEPARVRPE